MIRNLRMLSGTILLIFITSHLMNMAFGLISVRAVEEASVYLTVPWSFFPLGPLLFASLLLHAALGLQSLYKRNTLRMSGYDRLQLISGLLVIPLLAAHVVGIMAAKNIFGFEPTYQIILKYFWLDVPLEGLRQVLVVVVAWIHGCIGMFSWMRIKPWWRRTSWFVYPLVVAVPVLSLLGFVDAGNSVIAEQDRLIEMRLNDVLDQEEQPVLSKGELTAQEEEASIQAASIQAKVALQKTILWSVLTIYGVLVVLTLIARGLRLRRNTVGITTVRYLKGPQFDAPIGASLLEIARLNDVPHANLCRGRGRCGTCRLRVLEASPALPKASDIEQKTLDRLHCGPDIRLACQCIPTAGSLAIERLVAPDITPLELTSLAQEGQPRLQTWSLPMLNAQWSLPSRVMALCFVALALLSAIGPVAAQLPTDMLTAPAATQEPTTASPSPNDIRELMRLLSDQSMVEWLKTQGQNQGALDADGSLDQAPGLQQEFANRVERIRTRLQNLVISWRNVSSAPGYLVDSWHDQMSASETLRSITYVLIFLVIGGGLEWLYRQYTQYTLLKLELRKRDTLWGKFQAAVSRALIIAGGLLIFSVGTIGTFLGFEWPPFVENLVLNLLLIVIIVRLTSTISLFLFAPRVAALRLVPLDNALAFALHGWVVVLACFATIAFALTDVFESLAGSTDAVGATLAISVEAVGVCVLLLLLAVWHTDRGIKLRSNTVQTDAEKQTNFWPGYLSVIILVAFALWVLNAPEIMWTVIIAGLIFPATSLFNGCINHLFDQAEDASRLSVQKSVEIGSDAPQDQIEAEQQQVLQADLAEIEEEEVEAVSSLELYRPVARRFVRFVVLLGAIFALLSTWGGNIFSLSESQTSSGRLVGIIADIVTAILIADLVWVWAKSAIDRRLANYVPPQGSEAPGPEARMATLLPILRVTLMVFLIAIVFMTVLSSMGINVGPLLAGAGVLGIAIGFGAQALVKDIVAGVFFLIDDAFRIGEYIEVGSLRGTVESMSIRSLRVRHHLGAIHTIPFGELTSLTNYSRDWVIMRLEFRVPFDTDVKLIKKIVKKIGAELEANETYGDGILQTLKSQGVRRMEEFNMVIGVKFMAKPGAQWLIRRDAYQKLRDAFEENGISFAQRNVTVEVVSDKELDEEAQKAIAGAAQNAIEAAAGAAKPPPDEP